MERDGGDIQFPLLTAMVESVDVLQDVLLLMAAQVHQPLGNSVKHESIVGIGRMAKEKLHMGRPNRL